MPKRAFFLFLLSAMASCGIFNPIPQPRSEFRGVWIATVVNIDWPKSGFDPMEKKKIDYLEILDFYKDLNFNAVIVQIRAAGDAFYDSDHAPWSRFLTGTEGLAPKNDGGYLTWMIDEAHKRGMEFHAWLNPYRATFDLKTDILSPVHDFNLHPEWMLKYGKKYYYDPGLPEVRKRLVAIMEEVVSNHDVDAIHFDDYFYPYKIKDEVFKDSLSYSYYGLPDQSLDDWRRSNVDSLVKNTHEVIKKKKPWVQFGISPFGVWKNNSTDPKGSDTKAGQTTYEDLYADPLLWMKEGWIDYLVPQVYWSMELPVASHRKIVDWWAKNDSKNTNLYIGNGAYKVRNNSDKAWDSKKELPDQLTLARKTDAVEGNVFFSAKSMMKKNTDVTEHLKKKYYKRLALPPISPLSKTEFINDIDFKEVTYTDGMYQFNFNDSQDLRYAMVYTSGKKEKSSYPIKKLISKIYLYEPGYFHLPQSMLKGKKYIALTLIDKFGRETDPVVVKLN